MYLNNAVSLDGEYIEDVELQHWMYLNALTGQTKRCTTGRTTTLDVFKYHLEDLVDRSRHRRTTTLDVFKYRLISALREILTVSNYNIGCI